MRRGSLLLATSSLVLAAAIIGSSGTARGGGDPRVNPNYTPSDSYSVATVANPWQQFTTSVNPGSNIEFFSSSSGWKISGEGGQPFQFGNIGAGPGGANFVTWPGSTVSITTDGGVTWVPILQAKGGVWSIDPLNSTTGFVVGVSGLWETNDGGNTWVSLSEPSQGPLVKVQFLSQSVGIGATTQGKMVLTLDGGQTWRVMANQFSATAFCLTGSSSIAAADPSGNIYESQDLGNTWNEVLAQNEAQLPGESYGSVWTSMSCSGQNFTAAFQTNFGTMSPGFEVAASGDSGVTWTVVHSPSQDSNSNEQWPTIVSGVAVDQSGDSLVVGVSSSSSSLPIVTLDQNGNLVGQNEAPTVLEGPSAELGMGQGLSGAVIFGVAGQGSLLYIDATFDDGQGNYQNEVLKSVDGGVTWTATSSGAPLPLPAQISYVNQTPSASIS